MPFSEWTVFAGSSDALKDSVSVCLYCCLVVCNGSLDPMHVFGGQALAVELSTHARVPGLDALGSIRKVQLS